jgi:hypothetical protein
LVRTVSKENANLETSLCLERYANDELMQLRREVKRLNDLLQTERELKTKHNPDEELKHIKMQIGGFEERFKSEVNIIQ